MAKKRRIEMGKKALILGVCIGLLFAGVSVFLLATPGATQPAGQAKTLSIGALVASSGWFSVIETTDVADLLNMAKMINEKGGVTIKGQRYDVEIVTEDTKSTFDGCTAGANRLVFDKKVKFVLGPGGFFGPAAAPVFNPNKVLYVLSYATTQPGALGAEHPYGFLGNNASVGFAIVEIKALKKEFPNAKKVALMMPDDGSAPYLVPAIKRVHAQHGITMVGDVVLYPNEMQDFSPIAAKLDSMKDADAIQHAMGIPSHVGGIIKALRELGNSKPYIGSPGVNGTDVATIAGASNATNLVCTAMTPLDPSNPPLMNELLRKRTNDPKTRFMANLPNLLYILTNVMKAADSLDPDVVKAKWEKLDFVDTINGKGYVSGDLTYGIKHHAVGYPFPYQRVQDGKVVSSQWVEVGAIP
ncbi:MAG: ABC transporter substrate-binding protein [Thermodesulfobacteriota bacterium]|jgi:branched-chain amino acid transport system substrate-binding protein